MIYIHERIFVLGIFFLGVFPFLFFFIFEKIPLIF